ncbi:DUF6702 family protein [Winogradskyella sp. 3972H.M.0a.05]|uniref:DUF6702 family protein n=1 Tax=Winogradskyella sp. 3972H.M.0a.05 TaxID=2950277 RepID=UPI003396348B
MIKKLIQKTLILMLFVSTMSFQSAHKYYFSLTQIEHVQDSKALQIIMNVFIDDIERALEKQNDKSFKLNTPEEIEDVDTYIEAYLSERFNVQLNNADTTYKYIGHQYEGDVVYFYIEIENVTSVSSIEVENKVLMDILPEQQNLVKLKINKTFKSLMLTIDNYKGLLNF